MKIGAIALCPTWWHNHLYFHGIQCSKGRGLILPGGARERDETYKGTAVRELREELGLITTEDELRYIWCGPDGDDYLTFAFLVNNCWGEPKDLGSGEPKLVTWTDLKYSYYGAYYQILEEVFKSKYPTIAINVY